MNNPKANRFLLDTNILLGIVREADWAIDALKRLDLEDKEIILFTSIICKGEILVLGNRHKWGREKRARLDEILNTIPCLDINEQSPKTYSEIHAWTHGKPLIDSSIQNPPPKPAISMKEHDIWIAATAYDYKATLVSADKDFNHLNGVWIEVIYVDQHSSNSN